MIEPVPPYEVVKLKEILIPEKVIQILNELIMETWDGIEAIFSEEHFLERIPAEVEYNEDKEIGRNYLDIINIFEEAGWKVLYDWSVNTGGSFKFTIDSMYEACQNKLK